MSTIAQLSKDLQAAREQLNVALANGEDTAPIRATITDLEGKLANARRTEAEAAAAAQRAQDELTAKQGAVLANESHESMATRTEVEGLAELAGVDLTITEDADVVAAAQMVARARHALANAEERQRPMMQQAELIESRLTERQTELADIRARRLEGKDKPDDAAKASLLQADIDALLLLRDDARIKARAAEPHRERQAVQEAIGNLTRAEQRAVLKVATTRMQQAEQVFLRAHAALVNAGAATGERNQAALFKASPDLRRIVFGTTAGF
ncbi:MAG: hypothetical protein AB7E55_06710 [Pigmentiphaga sp.]